jgi:hypothetical protein
MDQRGEGLYITLYSRNISSLTYAVGERNQTQMIPYLRYQSHCHCLYNCCLYHSLLTRTNTQHVDGLSGSMYVRQEQHCAQAQSAARPAHTHINARAGAARLLVAGL